MSDIDVRRLRLEPGDTLLVRAPHEVSAEVGERIGETFRAALAEAGVEFHVPVIVCGPGAEVSVIRPGRAERETVQGVEDLPPIYGVPV